MGTDLLQRVKLESIKYLIEILHFTKENYVQHLLTPPKIRLSATFGEVRKKHPRASKRGNCLFSVTLTDHSLARLKT
jgi:hypothetical protein